MKPFADRLRVTAQPIIETALAVIREPGVERLEALRVRDRHQEVTTGEANQPLDLALVVALSRAAEAIQEQIVRLQLREDPRALPRAVAQDPGHRELGVVVQDRERNPAEEGERRHVTVAECLRRLRRIRLHEDRVAVRQIEGEEVNLAFRAADHGQRLAEVHLGMARRMRQRHEHLS